MFYRTKRFLDPSQLWYESVQRAGRCKHTKIVNGIWVHPNASISVGEITKKYGEPDFVAVSQDELQEGPTIQMYLYWNSNRMSVVLPKIDGEI